ncbi:hypothetical protein GCM10010193_06650 [Kitasatospora atroaurantiaca]|uniref:Uncharacterized protein n=1 Tax=Kitasatospora atroaurantiaca TaxID=285545 RepID=A0A561EJ33_9ACTN|nr:hypothetical protein FB465_0554 [Kitasatospora atroaurantiaca]
MRGTRAAVRAVGGVGLALVVTLPGREGPTSPSTPPSCDAPARAPHTFADTTDQPAVMLSTFTPDPYVQYFRDLQDVILGGQALTPQATLHTMSRYATSLARHPSRAAEPCSPRCYGISAASKRYTLRRPGCGGPLTRRSARRSSASSTRRWL